MDFLGRLLGILWKWQPEALTHWQRLQQHI
jgi:hypothetical protein